MEHDLAARRPAGVRGHGTTLAGAFLFLPVPAVLWLFTRAPFGVWRSEAIGLVLMLTHPLYARRFARRRADARCLWCGRATAEGPALTLVEPLGETEWRACGAPHRGSLRAVFGWAGAHALPLRVGILGTLAAFLVAAPLAAAGRLGPLTFADLRAFFQLGIALSVLPLALFGPRARPEDGPPRPPFPVHVPALIGTVAVLWLFRIVGAIWLVLGAVHVVTRLAP